MNIEKYTGAQKSLGQAISDANKPANDAHWYTLGGEPRHDATLREARKENAAGAPLFPSITTILGNVLAAQGLQLWKQNQLLEAQHNNPRDPDEVLEDYFRRIVAMGNSVAKEAAAQGNQIHDDCETLLHGGAVEMTPRNRAISNWIDKNVEEVFSTESALVSPLCGIAGRADAVVSLKGVKGQTVIDFKSRKFRAKKKSPCGWAPGWYDKDILQLAFYAHCIGEDDGERAVSCLDSNARIANIGINTNPDAPEDLPPVPELYSVEDQQAAFSIVPMLSHIWQWRHNYRPEIPVEAFESKSTSLGETITPGSLHVEICPKKPAP